MRRVITIAILIIICFLLQSAIFSFHDVTGSAPNLLLILTMSFGIMRGRREGLLTGFFCGFLCDVFYNSFLGPYMLLYMVIGYVNGFFHKDYLMEDLMMPVFIIAIDEFVFNFFVYICTFIIRNRTDIHFYFNKVFLPQIFFTVLATVLIYRILVNINKKLKKKQKKLVLKRNKI